MTWMTLHALRFFVVEKKRNVIQVRVDAVSEHGVGPKQSRSNGANVTVYLGNVPGMPPLRVLQISNVSVIDHGLNGDLWEVWSLIVPDKKKTDHTMPELKMSTRFNKLCDFQCHIIFANDISSLSSSLLAIFFL